MGLFNIPTPVDLIETIKDEGEKRAALSLAMSFLYSQYITGLYSLGTAIQAKRLIGFLGAPLVAMAASGFKMLQLQSSNKLIYLSVPTALVEDNKLLDSVWWEKEQQK